MSYYLTEIFKFPPYCRINTRNKFAKLKVPFRKIKMGQKAISFVGPSLWHSLPELIFKNVYLNILSIMLKTIACIK